MLDILCRRLKDESADLVYLDSSFNPAQSYGVVEKSGSAAASQIHAFEDN